MTLKNHKIHDLPDTGSIKNYPNKGVASLVTKGLDPTLERKKRGKVIHGWRISILPNLKDLF
jgi:hypothetical protein